MRPMGLFDLRNQYARRGAGGEWLSVRPVRSSLGGRSAGGVGIVRGCPCLRALSGVRIALIPDAYRKAIQRSVGEGFDLEPPAVLAFRPDKELSHP